MSGGLHAALLAVQAEMPTMPKTATNPHFKSKYTPLDTVVEIATPILVKHGLTWSAWPSFIAETGQPSLKYKLTHAETGQFEAGEMPLLLSKNDPQGQGSAITYARRYAESAVLNIVADEDVDGNMTARPVAANAPNTQPPPTSKTTAEIKTLTQAQANKVASKLLEYQVTDEKLQMALVGAYAVNNLTELTVAQAQALVKSFA